ncbi:glycosyltransferase family 87 protein [Parasphingorhabdus pacifica]
MALVPGKSRDPVLTLDGFVDQLRAFVVTRAHWIIGVSIPLIVLSLATMVALGRAGIDQQAAIDYQVYRWAVETWLSGGDIMNDAPTTSIGTVLPWVYPPFALLPLMPLALLPFLAGLLTLYGLNLATLCAVMYLVVRRMWPAVGERGALAVSFAFLPWTLFLEPVYSTFGLGQVNLLLMGLVALDCLVTSPRWPRGTLVGIAAAIKLTPAVFLLFFLARRDYRASATVVVTGAFGTFLGFVLNMEAAVEYWFGTGPAGGISGSTFHTNQSVLGGLARLDLPAPVEMSIWGLVCVILTVLAVGVLRRADAVQAMSVVGLLGLLLSPTSWSNHWVWVVPGVLTMLGCALMLRSKGWFAATVVTTTIGVFGSFRLAPAQDPLSWSAWHHVVGNAYLLLGVVLLVALRRYVRIVAGDVNDEARGPDRPPDVVASC